MKTGIPFYILVILSISISGYGQSRIISDSVLDTASYLWSKDTIYFLDGFVFLEAGGELTIEAGTVIKGLNQPSNDDIASALIITKGAKINAIGTADKPIIFTAELDDINDNSDLLVSDKGLWGGLVILGDATVGQDGGIDNIEGIPSTEGRATYGGTNDQDNSGTLKYVSIRHGGAELGPDNEINGLTLGGVGSGTSINFVEVISNSDDGIEWFGGTVDVKHAVVAFCGDDSYDYDQSWNGRGQFWFTIQEEDNGNNGGEHDGSEAVDLTPKVNPKIYNATYIGAGANGKREKSNTFLIRNDAAATYINSIFTDFGNQAIHLQNASEQDSYQRLLDGDIVFKNNLWFGFGAGNELSDIVAIVNGDGNPQVLIDSLVNNGNTLTDPELAGIGRSPNGMLDPRPNTGSPALSGADIPSDNWFENTAYRGAFGNDNNWALGWTALDAYGYFGNLVISTSVNPALRKAGISLKVFPNPVYNGLISVDLEVDNPMPISYKLFDLAGRQILNSKSQNMVGPHQFQINLQGLNAGTYLLMLIGDSTTLTQKIVIRK